MKRYLVFIIPRTYLGFGWESFSGDFDTLEGAIEKATSIKDQTNMHSHVVDTLVAGSPEDRIIRRYSVFWTPDSFREYKKHRHERRGLEMTLYAELLKYIPTEALMEEVQNRRAAELVTAIFNEEPECEEEKCRSELVEQYCRANGHIEPVCFIGIDDRGNMCFYDLWPYDHPPDPSPDIVAVVKYGKVSNIWNKQLIPDYE